ncbi:MAG: hypothetical protein NTW48_02150 [Chloroflexi bacterium]|nr:hypothetical protein [Chloroflexota bacterium]
MAVLGKKLESFSDDPYNILNPSRDDMRKSDRNASLNQITTYIYQSLLDFQGKWNATDRGALVIQLPNARYLAIGDNIKNISTGANYVIDEVISEASRGGVVRFRSTGVAAPKMGDFLSLEEKNTVNFQSSYSRYYQDSPVEQWRDTIVYRVKRREPGTIGKHPFDPPTEIKPRIREQRVDPDHPGCHIVVMGQWFDNLIQFDVWSKFNNRADDLIEWFEDFMYKYIWVWKKNGVNEILYWMRNSDSEVSKWRNDLAVRTVLYYFKTEKIVTVQEYDLRQIDLYLENENTLPSGFYGVGYGNVLPASGYLETLDKGFRAFT